MSSMLEQAIVDAQALREAALKNAEQALIEKFAPQIKEAVETLLEGEEVPQKKKVSYEGKNYTLQEIEDGKATIMREGEKPFVVSESELSEAIDEKLLQEEEGGVGMDAGQSSAVEAPPAFAPNADMDTPVRYSLQHEEPIYEFDLSELALEEEEVAQEAPAEEPAAEEEPEGLEGEEDLLALQEGLEENDEDQLVSEIMKILEESGDLLEEELVVDMGHEKDGTYQEMQSDKDNAEALAMQKDEENKDLKKENENLKETLKRFKHKNKQYKDVVEKLSQKVNETLLSNAKLLYSNKTLGDASLNERQKTKI